jgi:hypothetical protein
VKRALAIVATVAAFGAAFWALRTVAGRSGC